LSYLRLQAAVRSRATHFFTSCPGFAHSAAPTFGQAYAPGAGIIFLKDVAVLAFTAFGGPQAHLAMMFRLLVDKRRYISTAELLELQALCALLPGPTSTQTITVIGFRWAGPTWPTSPCWCGPRRP
jgi:hypothetical protein